MTKQRGMGVLGTLIMLAGIVLIAVLGMKLVPAYIEYFSVKKIVADIAASGEARTPAEVRKAFQKRADVDYLDAESVSANDVQVTKDEISFAYEKRIPLFANITVLIDFAGESPVAGRP